MEEPTGHRGGVALRWSHGPVVLFVLVCLGLLVGDWMGGVGALWMLLGAAGLGVGGWLLGGVRGWAVVGAGVVACGAGYWGVRVEGLAGDSVAHWLTEEARVVLVEGEVVTTPSVERVVEGSLAGYARYRPEAVRFELRVERVVDVEEVVHGASGRLFVSVALPRGAEPPGLGLGDRVRVLGYGSLIGAPRNPGAMDGRDGLRARGVVGGLRVVTPELVEVLPRDGGLVARVGRWLGGVRPGLARPLEEGAGGPGSPGGALAMALLLGERTAGYGELQGAFSRIGIAHLLAISGLHLVAVLFAVVFVVRLFGDYPRVTGWLVVGVLLVALVVVPARSPIVRAALMFAGLSAAGATGRRVPSISALALVGVVVLAWRPTELMSAGFQLSFGVVAGLILLAGPLRDRVFGELKARDLRTGRDVVWGWATGAVSASVVAWGVASPITAYHFGVVSPIGVPMAVLATPLLAVFLPMGYVLLVLGQVWGWAGAMLLRVTGWVADGAMWLDGLPGVSVRVPTIPGWLVWALIGLVCWWCLIPADKFARRRWWGFARRWLTVVVVVGGGVVVVEGERPPRGVVLEMTVLDVGDGSAYLLRSGGEAMLFDCGSTRLDVGVRMIPNACRALGASTVERVVVSHADIDHYAGLLDVVGPLGVARVVTTAAVVERSGASGAEGAVLAGLAARGVAVEAVARGETMTLGGCAIAVLHPGDGDVYSEDNDGSLVLLITVGTDDGQRRVLLTADIEGVAMGVLRGREPGLAGSVHVMDAPHHGSARGGAVGFVEWVDPGVVVQSTGPSRVGLPEWAGVAADRWWLSTPELGAVRVRVWRDGGVSAEGLGG